MKDRYAIDIVVTVLELEILKDHIEQSYSKVRNDGKGYGMLPEWRIVMYLLARAEDAALAKTFGLSG